MSYKDQIKKLSGDLKSHYEKTSTLFKEIDAKQADQITADERTKLNNMIDAGDEMRVKLDQLTALESQRALLEDPAEPAVKESRPRGREVKTWGQIVTASEQFKTASRGSVGGDQPRMNNVNVKAMTADATSAGSFVLPYRLPEVVGIEVRATTILDLLNTVRVSSNSVEYVKQTLRQNNAAPVAEPTGDTFALKPESNYGWELATTTVKTIATWIPVGTNILDDVPMLQNLIDQYLTEDLRIALENQVIRGDGTGPNLLGILNTPGLLTRTQGTSSPRGLAGDTVADTLRRAITDVRLQFYEPDGIAINPVAGEDLELIKDTTGQYVRVFDPATGRIWQVPVVQTQAMQAKEALVGNWSQAVTLFDRMEAMIRVGTINDNFVRNLIVVLAELRAALAVIRPQAMEKVTLS